MARDPKTPHEAYEAIQRSAQPKRLAEATAFARAATMLEIACREPVDRRRLDAALRRNQVLWTMVQDEVASPGNRLPPELKDNLLKLSAHVDRQTLVALASGDPRDVAGLIAIDRDMAEGLSDGPTTY